MHNESLSVVAVIMNNEDVSPSESTLTTQSKLQLLRLSAISSQYFHKGARFLLPVALADRYDEARFCTAIVFVLREFDGGRPKMMRRLHKIRLNSDNKR
jgi:hypothetical protein